MNIFSLLVLRSALIAYGSILIFMFFPLVIVLFSNILGTLSGCPEGAQWSNKVCTNGDLIAGLGQAGWLLVFTLPVGLLLLGMLVLTHIVLFFLVKKKAVVAAFLIKKISKKLRK